MNSRALLATTTALGLVMAGAAVAAPKPRPVCNLIADPTADTFVARAQESQKVYGPQEDTLDIVSADIATNASTVTGVVRVKKAAKSGTTSPTGNGYSVDFLVPGSTMTMSLRATYTPALEMYELSYKDASLPNSPSTMIAKATGTLDAAKNEIRISAPLTALSAFGGLKAGQKVLGLEAYSGRAVPPVVAQPGQPISSRFVFADTALEGKTYTAGAPSCVPVGK